MLYELIFTIIFKKNNSERWTTDWRQLSSLLLIILSISFIAYSLTLATILLFRISDPIRTAEFGKVFLNWDRAIFKTDPGIWMINNLGGTFWEKILLWTYMNIFEVLSIVILVSFILNKKAFRKLIMSFFISWIIALPLWFLFPTLSPDFMFRLNELNAAGVQDIKAFNNFTPSTLLKNDLQNLDAVHITNKDPANRLLSISTFPSMHAAWGTIIAYAGMIISPWLGIILIPLSIINDISCVYILEHFFVDVLLGIIIALISIIITELLLRLEAKYFKDKFGLLSGLDYIKTIIKNFQG